MNVDELQRDLEAALERLGGCINEWEMSASRLDTTGMRIHHQQALAEARTARRIRRKLQYAPAKRVARHDGPPKPEDSHK